MSMTTPISTGAAPAVALNDAPPPLSPATATVPQRWFGITLMVTGAAGNQVGAALGALAFPAIGPVGVVAIRQLFTAVVLLPLARPRFLRYGRAEWLPILGLALVFSVMNVSLYASVQRIGLGLAVTLEFLGPLGVALFASRRRVDLGCALLAAAGVLVLTHPGPSSDLLGIALGLLAAAAWAMYILLNRALGQRLPGIEGTAAASAVAAAVWLPIAILWFTTHPLSTHTLLLAVSCAALSSAVPYVIDLVSLRRIPAELFGILASTSPVWAALVGWIVLGERLLPAEWLGIGIIVASSTIVSLLALRRPVHSAAPVTPVGSDQAPKYASITRGSAASSAAGPSMVTRPDSST